jgi:prevent-host-death family protein
MCYMSHITAMRTAGIREARQNLSTLIDEVKKGRVIVITDRGRPVARLVPPAPVLCNPFPDRSAFRRTMPVLTPALSATLVEERADPF